MGSDELDQVGADLCGDMNLVEIGGNPGGCEFSRMSPSQRRSGQRAVGVENRRAQRAVVARAATALAQKLGDLGVLFANRPMA